MNFKAELVHVSPHGSSSLLELFCLVAQTAGDEVFYLYICDDICGILQALNLLTARTLFYF